MIFTLLKAQFNFERAICDKATFNQFHSVAELTYRVDVPRRPVKRPWAWLSSAMACKDWWDVVSSTPSLWNTIDLALPFPTEDQFRTLLLRSEEAPLAINFSLAPQKIDDELERLILANVRRIAHIIINTISQFPVLFDDEMPSLRTLYIAQDIPLDVVEFGFYENLTTLDFAGMLNYDLPDLTKTFSHLTSLRLAGPGLCGIPHGAIIGEFPKQLSSLTALRKLSIIEGVPYVHHLPHNVEPFKLHVTHLVLEDQDQPAKVIRNFLSHFTLPDVKDMFLHGTTLLPNDENPIGPITDLLKNVNPYNHLRWPKECFSLDSFSHLHMYFRDSGCHGLQIAMWKEDPALFQR